MTRVDVTGVSMVGFQVFIILGGFCLFFLLQKNIDLDKKNFKTFIVSFSLFFVLSHILSYATPLASYLPYPAPYAIPYLISYLILFIYLLITQRKNFNLPSLIVYSDLFLILQAILYLIISQVRYSLGYDFSNKEYDQFVFYLILSGVLSYLFFFIAFFDSFDIFQKNKEEF